LGLLAPEDIEMDDKEEEPQSDSEDEDSDEEGEGRGVDNLKSSSRFDIPRVNDIPIVS